MYFWQPIAASFYSPCVDGDYDMSIIGHEYGHMIENRMIGKGNIRAGFHAGAMGESFGDLNALEYLNENGFVRPRRESAVRRAVCHGQQAQRHPRTTPWTSRCPAPIRSPASS